jgi:excisionase family DNA binding protein
MSSDVCRVHEAAALLGVTELRVYELVRAGVIPAGAFFRVGRRVQFVRPRLLEWRDAGGAALPGGWRRTPIGAA